jgi:SAM-dependent methyltransferase
MVIPSTEVSLSAVATSLGRHVGLYRHRAPHYQTVMLNSLLSLWTDHHERIIDIGGGTGVIGQCIDDLLPAGSVVSVDVADRFCKTLAIKTDVFDGRKLPFADAAFDAATINNVVHHIPLDDRVPLFREIRRINRGPLYIKDHLARSNLDHLRLGILDLIGNIPFGGMVRARYLSKEDWTLLAKDSGFKIADTVQAAYRSGVFAALFPNRIETAMRWEPV